MVKRLCAFILSAVIILFAVSMNFVVKLGLEAKEKEYYNREFDSTRYGYDYYEEAFKEGELTLQDTLNGLCVYSKSAEIPVAAYNVIFDKNGNVAAESGTMLELEFYNDDYYSGKRYFVSLEPYITEEVRNQILELNKKTQYHRLNLFEGVELYRDGDNITPVALVAEYADETYRIKLSDEEANVVLGKNSGYDGKFYFLPHNIENEMPKHYEYLKSVAEEQIQQVKDGEKLVDSSTGGGGPYYKTNTSYSINVLNLDGETYYYFYSESANSVYSMLSDENYIEAFVKITAVYVLVAAALCISVVKFSKEQA